MNFKRNYRAFTLIELLVVIAIIGILASIVLASLNTARSKGNDAAIKTAVNNSRAQAELYYDSNLNSYNRVCAKLKTDTPPGIKSLSNAASNAGAPTVNCGDLADGSAWAMEAQLTTTGVGWYCVDSTGVSATTSASTVTDGSNQSGGTADAKCK